MNYNCFVFNYLKNMSYNDDEELKIGDFEEEEDEDLDVDIFDDTLDDDFSEPLDIDDEEEESFDKIADIEGTEL